MTLSGPDPGRLRSCSGNALSPGRIRGTRWPSRRVEGHVKIPLTGLPLAAACLAGLVASCSGPPPAGGHPAVAPPATGRATSQAGALTDQAGTLTGHLYGVGGPAPGAPRPWPGTVTLTGPGVRRDIQVSADGHFSVLVPAGTYTVAGRSPRYGSGAGVCRATGPATVTAGHRTRADVRCQLK
jgi:hypothetical protein